MTRVVGIRFQKAGKMFKTYLFLYDIIVCVYYFKIKDSKLCLKSKI